MLGTWKVNGGRETRRFSQYTGAVQQSRTLRRNNARRACYLCRRKKLKCSGEAGSCERCRKLDTKCKYPPNVEEQYTAQDDNAQGDDDCPQDRRLSDSSQHIDGSRQTSPYHTARSNIDDNDDMHTLSSPRLEAGQILSDDCIDFDYLTDAAGSLSTTSTSLLTGIPSTRASEQGFNDPSIESLVGHPCFSSMNMLSCGLGHPFLTPLGTQTWITGGADQTTLYNDSSSPDSNTLDGAVASGPDETDYFMLSDHQAFDSCECLQTAAHVFHELSAHTASSTSGRRPSLDQHLELFDSCARRLRCIADCASCRFHAENMMINAMALQQLCGLCEQMTTIAGSDTFDSRFTIDIRIGQSQVQLGNERALICSAIVASQFNIFTDLVKDFKMASMSMPTPFALLEAIENRIARMRAATST